ncbi:MAG: glutamyl-tRNA reductase [Gemmatimonadaceae bacterium]
MSLLVTGVNHRTAPIEIREKLCFSKLEGRQALEGLRDSGVISEAVMLSTCNRTEIYMIDSNDESATLARDLLSSRLGADVSQYVYVHRDREAVRHLFGVSSGLDSMILGEAQIHGQVRDAWEGSREESGAALNRLFQTSLLVGSRVREETGIGRGAASVSSAAVQLSKKIFGSLSGRRAMVLGAGDVAAIALACLRKEGVRVSIVANRTFERAEALAAEHGASAMHYDECWQSLHTVDILLCSTASPHPIVEIGHVKPALAQRGGRPLCILDIALPRDVASNVAELENVFLYDLDSLKAAAAANLERRNEDIPAAEKIIRSEVDKYWQWLAGLAAVPVVTEFRSQMERVRADELSVALKHMGDLSDEQTEAVKHFSRALMNKFLHEPSVRLKAAAANGRGLGVVDAARYLFALEDKPISKSDVEQ